MDPTSVASRTRRWAARLGQRLRHAPARGSAQVEFVLALPILFTAFSLVVDLGYGLAHRQAMEFAAGQGAFAASLYPPSEAEARVKAVVLENERLAPGTLHPPAPGECPNWDMQTERTGSPDEALPLLPSDLFDLNRMRVRALDTQPYLQVTVSCRVQPPLPVFLPGLMAPLFDFRVERVGRMGCWTPGLRVGPCE